MGHMSSSGGVWRFSTKPERPPMYEYTNPQSTHTPAHTLRLHRKHIMCPVFIIDKIQRKTTSMLLGAAMMAATMNKLYNYAKQEDLHR